MNHSALLRRALDLTRRYRVLWLFGILVALTGVSTSAPNSNNLSYRANNYDFRNPNLPDFLRQWGQSLSQFDPSRYVGLFIACCCLLVLLGIAALVLRYVARAALIRSVDQIETTGRAPTWREGFRLGWSSRTFRLWLLDLVVTILALLAIVVLLLIVASPMLLFLAQNDAARVTGAVLALLLALPVILIIIAGIIVLSVLGQFWTREIILSDATIGDAIRNGTAQVRRRLRDVGVLTLLMAGIQIAFSLVMIPVFFVVIAIAVLLGGGLGYALYAASHSVGWAIALGLPIFLVVLAVPLAFIGGLFESFKSSVWTLAYREVAQLEGA